MRFTFVARLSTLLFVAAFAAGCAAEDASGSKIRSGGTAAEDDADDNDPAPSNQASTNDNGGVAPVVTPATAPAEKPVETKPVITKPAIACNTSTDSVVASYWIALQRKPDDGGLQHWVAKIDGGASRHGVLKEIIQSTEFANVHEQQSNADFIVTLYRSFFDRDPDQAGFEGWLGNLNNGGSRTGIALAFADSAEFKDPNSNRAAACYF